MDRRVSVTKQQSIVKIVRPRACDRSRRSRAHVSSRMWSEGSQGMTVACFGRADAARREAHRHSRTLRGWRQLIVICWFLPFCGTLSGQAAAGSLDEAAERYRPLMIKEIGMALSCVRDLRESISRSDLPSCSVLRRCRLRRRSRPGRLRSSYIRRHSKITRIFGMRGPPPAGFA